MREREREGGRRREEGGNFYTPMGFAREAMHRRRHRRRRRDPRSQGCHDGPARVDRGRRGQNDVTLARKEKAREKLAKRLRPGCVNAACKLRAGRSGEQQQEQNSPKLAKAF